MDFAKFYYSSREKNKSLTHCKYFYDSQKKYFIKNQLANLNRTFKSLLKVGKIFRINN